MLTRLLLRLRRELNGSFRSGTLAVIGATTIAAFASLGGSWGDYLGQTAPGPAVAPGPAPPVPAVAQQVLPAFPTIPPVTPEVGFPCRIPLSAGVQAGSALLFPLTPTGGQLRIPDTGMTVTILPGAIAQDMVLYVVPVVPDSSGFPLPGLPTGSTALDMSLVNPVTCELQLSFNLPVVITYEPTTGEMAAVAGDLSRVALAYLHGESWGALPSNPNLNGTITYFASHLTLLETKVESQEAKVGRVSTLSNGQFFTATNGFGGLGGTGFAVIDDESAAFFSELQRFGGTDRLGLPVTGRFFFGGFITQAFQKLALQWRPELHQAVPVNILDELNRRGADGFLDIFREIPPAEDTSPDTGLTWDEVVARHLAILDAVPALREAYFADPNPLETYGLPLSVKYYGPFVTARLQRGTLQLWKVDVLWATAGAVVLGNAGDLAKEVGLWPIDAMTPRPPPEPMPGTS